MGSEGEGVSKTISKLAHHAVIIPPHLSMDKVGKYPYNIVDSLNVGVTSALFLHHVKLLREGKLQPKKGEEASNNFHL